MCVLCGVCIYSTEMYSNWLLCIVVTMTFGGR